MEEEKFDQKLAVENAKRLLAEYEVSKVNEDKPFFDPYKQIISEYMSNLGRLSHQKHPRSKEFYSSMGKIGKRKPKVV